MTAPLTEPPVLLTKEAELRTEFEDWYCKRHGASWLRMNGNGYENKTAQSMWVAYQECASRRTVVVPAQDAADARRYRWIATAYVPNVRAIITPMLGYGSSKKELDAAIDAALAATQEKP